MTRYQAKLYLGAFLSALALFVSAYLASRKTTVICSRGFSCDTVLNSPYAHLFGVPLSYIGVIAFTLLIVLFILAASQPKPSRLLAPAITLGAITALGLVFVQAFLLRAYCEYCLTIELLMFWITLLFWPEITSFWQTELKTNRQIKPSPQTN